MTSKTFSGTSVAWSLLGESSPGSGFSAIWRQVGETGGALASVNSGNNAFWVDGRGINQTFEKSFGSAVAAFFMPVHSGAMKAARAGTPVTTNFVAPQPVQLVSVHLPDGQGPSAAFPDETVFLDILTAAVQPNGNANNAAMIYAVPPDGRTAFYTSDSMWLDSIARTAANAVAVLADYNAVQIATHPALGLAPIPVLRMCSLGGKIFRKTGVGTPDLANAIFAGVADALTTLTKAGTAHGIVLVEFENGDHGFDALK